MTQTKKAAHPSLERLLSVAAEIRKTKGPAALAAALNESEQTLNNWKLRGVSKSGALKAQSVYGCSPNWILNGSLPKFPAGDQSVSATVHHVQQSTVVFTWPFKGITPAEYNQVLTAEDREVVHNTALALFNARGGRTKQTSPAKYRAAH